MNKEIEELADVIYWKDSKFEIVTKSGCEDFAEMLYKAGYRKQVWHKVKDGDFPEYEKYVVCIMTDRNIPTIGRLIRIDNLNFHGDMWEMDYDEDYYHRLNEVIAWTELPEYKE